MSMISTPVILRDKGLSSYLYTIVVPIYGRSTELGYLLRSIACGLDGEAELLIADGSPEALNITELHSIIPESDKLSRVVYGWNPAFSIVTAKNAAFSLHSNSQYTIFADSDIILSETFFPSINSTFDQYPVDVLSVPSEYVDLDSSKSVEYYLEKYRNFYWLNDQKNPCKPEPDILEWGEPIDKSIFRVPAIHGMVIAIKTEHVDQAFFDPLFAMHGENVYLAAQLQQRGLISAYIMKPGVWCLHLESAGFSVTRNLDGRGPHIFKTLVLMLYRNFSSWKQGVEYRFRHLIESKWVPMIGNLLPVPPEKILRTAESYASLLEQHYLHKLTESELEEQLKLLPVPETSEFILSHLPEIVNIREPTINNRLYYLS